MDYTNAKSGRTAARYFRSLAVAKDIRDVAMSFADSQGWTDGTTIKAAVSPMAISDPGLAGQVGQDFVAMVYPRTIIGRLNGLRRVSMRVATVRQTSGLNAYWVPEKGVKPIGLMAFEKDAALMPRKVVGITVITEEMARESTADAIIQTDLRGATVKAMDASFIAPSNAGVDEEEPASVTHDATTIDSSGDLATDAKAAIAAFDGDLTTAAWVMHPKVAAAGGLSGGSMGVALNLGALGGNLAGLPVLTSEGVPYDSSGSPVALIDAAGIEYAGSDQAQLRTSREAAILMTDIAPDATQQLVSLFQTDSIALMGEIYCNWRVVRAGGVVVVNGASYLGS